jgi:hypothetical protein
MPVEETERFRAAYVVAAANSASPRFFTADQLSMHGG